MLFRLGAQERFHFRPHDLGALGICEVRRSRHLDQSRTRDRRHPLLHEIHRNRLFLAVHDARSVGGAALALKPRALVIANVARPEAIPVARALDKPMGAV